MSLNRWIGMGRLTADPELKTTQTGLAVVRFSIAIDKTTKDGEKKADFIGCTAFGKTAEMICRYFQKGKMIAVEGSLNNNSYVDQNGTKHSTMQISVTNVSFCGDRQAVGQPQQPQQQQYQQPMQKPMQKPMQQQYKQPIINDIIGNLSDYESIISDGAVPF